MLNGAEHSKAALYLCHSHLWHNFAVVIISGVLYILVTSFTMVVLLFPKNKFVSRM